MPFPKEPWNKGKALSPELRAKLSAAHQGKPWTDKQRAAYRPPSEETRTKWRQARLDHPHPEQLGWPKGKAKTEAHIAAQRAGLLRYMEEHPGIREETARQTHTGRKRSPETRARMSEAQKAKWQDPAYRERMRDAPAKRIAGGVGAKISAATKGHPARYSTHRNFLYGGLRMRSSYEVRVAKALDVMGIPWEYEPRRFDLGSRTYLPDFYLPDNGAYWEVKGWLGPKSQETVQLFRRTYPDLPLVVVGKAVLLALERSASAAMAA